MSAYDNKYWSHRIAQLAEKVPETDDLSFFASEAYRDFTEQGVKDLICGTCTYLRTLGYDITKEQEEERINDMVVMMSTDENMTACTNGDSMIIGVNSSLVKYFPNRELRHYAIQGLRVHETAHVLFTDFKTIDMWQGALSNGNWWPVVPDHAQDPDGAELTQVLSKKEFSKSFAAIAGRLQNAIEDGFIEREIKEMYKGLATTELCTTNDAQLSMASTFGEFLKAGHSAYSAMFQQVLMYAKYDITMVDEMRAHLTALERQRVLEQAQPETVDLEEQAAGVTETVLDVVLDEPADTAVVEPVPDAEVSQEDTTAERPAPELTEKGREVSDQSDTVEDVLEDIELDDDTDIEAGTNPSEVLDTSDILNVELEEAVGVETDAQRKPSFEPRVVRNENYTEQIVKPVKVKPQIRSSRDISIFDDEE